MPDSEIKVRPGWLDEIFTHYFWKRCAQRVLVVTDGLSFDAANSFGLTVFLGELAKAYPTPAITTQVHGPFVFDATITTAKYDQIWLFGIGGPVLTVGELTVLKAFMDAGGGLFATGDHEKLGLQLCGSIPRVRGMREWSTIPMEIDRIDTVTNPGDDAIVTFNDQSDTHPQRIYPVFHGSGSSWAPHALLQSAKTIDVLPDHPHESVCYGGASTQHQGDFPVVGGSPLLPEIVAYSVSAGRYVTDKDKPPTTPRLFGAISAYDGHRAQQGRIVCDATWHHYVNINLDGTGSGRIGLQSSPGTFTEDFQQIARYYRNILDWLTPVNRVWCFRWIWIVIERYRYPLWEEFVPLPDPHPCPWDPRVALGRTVEAALRGRHGSGSTWDWVTDALAQAGQPKLAELVRPRSTDLGPARGEKLERTLVPPDELRYGILGSIADALLSGLPQNPHEVKAAKGGHDDKAIEAAVVKAAKEAVEAAREHYGAAAKRTLALF